MMLFGLVKSDSREPMTRIYSRRPNIKAEYLLRGTGILAG